MAIYGSYNDANLDDNTYTNKTWADVCGMNVEELHQMEMELLGNLRYNLFVSEQQWHSWEDKIVIFKTYCDKASKLPFEDHQHSPAATLPSPYYYNGPSPAPQIPNLNVPANASCGTQYMQGHPPPQLPPMSSDIHNEPFLISRKRTLDAPTYEPPMKKFAPNPSHNIPPASTLPSVPLPVIDTTMPSYQFAPSGVMPQPNATAKPPPPASMAAFSSDPTRILNDAFASLQHAHASGKQNQLATLPNPSTSSSNM
ncbi:hypothetical protein KEM56_003281, partial [Ascosphaera pollenicola]